MLTPTTYSVAGCRVAALESGSAAEDTLSVIFLHGWQDNAASFFTVLSSLIPICPGVHLCAIDLPGHGLSEHKPAGYYYPFHDYVDDIHQILADIPAKTVILVGHSLGGLISCCYSAAFPEQVTDIILIDALSPLAEPPEACVRRLRDGVLGRQRIRRKRPGGYRSMQQALSHRAEVAGLPEPLLRPLVERGLEQRGERWFWRTDPAVSAGSLYRMSPPHATAILNAVQSRVTVVAGTDGYRHLMVPEHFSLPEQMNIYSLAGGHYCHLEHPEKVVQIIGQVVTQRLEAQDFSVSPG